MGDHLRADGGWGGGASTEAQALKIPPTPHVCVTATLVVISHLAKHPRQVSHQNSPSERRKEEKRSTQGNCLLGNYVWMVPFFL